MTILDTGWIGRVSQSWYLNLKPVTFAQLPNPAHEGDLARITDSTANKWGLPAAGGGTFHALVSYNGTLWTVVGL
jgi:hypothetical protein